MNNNQRKAAYRLAEAMDMLLQEVDSGDVLVDARNEAYCALQDFWTANATEALYSAVLNVIEDVQGAGRLGGEAFTLLQDAARAFGKSMDEGATS